MKSHNEVYISVMKKKEIYEENMKKKKPFGKSSGMLAFIVACCIAILSYGVMTHLQKNIGVAPDEGNSQEVHPTEDVASPTGTAPSPTETIPEPTIKILWKGTEPGDYGIKNENEEEKPKGFFMTKELQQAMRQVADGELIAVTVNAGKRGYPGSLWNEYDQAQVARSEAYQKVYEELKTKYDITGHELSARAMSSAEVVAASAEEDRALQNILLLYAKATYTNSSKVISVLEEEGFQKLGTAKDENYRDYLAATGCMAVYAGTAEQLEAIAKREADGYIVLDLAWEEAEEYRFPPYTYYDMLEDGSKLTNNLLATYEANDGAAIEVRGYLGYLGKPIDPHAMAYAAIGMTAAEFNNAKDLSNEVVDLYLETLNEYTYMKTYQRELLQSILKDGELIEHLDYLWEFHAKLTYERALELTADPRVAYIGLPEKSSGYPAMDAADE